MTAIFCRFVVTTKQTTMTNLLQETEVWKDITGYEGRYQISSFARVRSLVQANSHGGGVKTRKTPVIREPHLNTSGYYHLRLSKDGVGKDASIHRLVAIAFIPNPDNLPEVNHLFGKLNNLPHQLEWTTSRDNQLHAYRTGLKRRLRNELNPKAKLTRAQVLEIFNSKGVTLHGLAAMYNVSSTTIQFIRYGRSWSDVTGKKCRTCA